MNIHEILNEDPEVGDIVEMELGDTLIETVIDEILEDGVVIRVNEEMLSLMIQHNRRLNEDRAQQAAVAVNMKKAGKKPNQDVSEDEDPCWKGYKQVGMKDKDGRKVPNCVPNESVEEGKTGPGLWANIHAKRKRIKGGSGERMRKPGSEGAPKSSDLEASREKNESSNYGDLDEAKYQGREVTLNQPMAGDVKKSKVYVKNAKGNVVKVNFGQKGVKIKKSNPGRRKSFRARHGCDNPGPKWKAKYWSCRAW